MKKIFLLFISATFLSQLLFSQEYTVISDKTSDLWIYPGITMDVVPYGEISSTGSAFIGIEKYYKRIAFNTLLTYYLPTEMIKKAGTQYGNIEIGMQYNLSDNNDQRNIEVKIRSEDAGYQKTRVYYYDVPTNRRLIKAIRGGIISNPYADAFYAGWSYINMRNVTVASSVFENGKKSSSRYMKFGADLITTYHRSDFYDRFIGNDYNKFNPSSIGFRVFGAFNYDWGPFGNLMVTSEFGKRDSWYINLGFSYLINNTKN
jgi:hypothetical protein